MQAETMSTEALAPPTAYDIDGGEQLVVAHRAA